MDIWHNPLGEMYGPYFLVLYIVVIVVVTSYARSRVVSLDDSLERTQPLQIPQNADPYEIAFLRGGVNEVIRVATYKLTKLGYLEIVPMAGRKGKSTAQQIQHNIGMASPSTLNGIETQLLQFFETPHTSEQLFSNVALINSVKQLCANYEEDAIREKLIASPSWKTEREKIVVPCAIILVGLALYKLIAATITGHSNIWFLVGLCFIGPVVLFTFASAPKLTKRGQRYMLDLKHVYGAFPRSTTASILSPVDINANYGFSPDASVLPVAILGMAALSPTADAQFRQVFNKASTTSSSGGCGSGCGGGCGGCGGGD